MYARLFLVLPLALPLACGAGGDDDDNDNGPDAAVDFDASPTCLEAQSHDDLAWLQEKVFTPSCTLSASCHKGPALMAAMLNMEDGNTEANLIDRVAISEGIEGMGLTIVVPGDSTTSYLMVLIDHESRGGRLSGPLPTALTMPFNNSLMCVEKRDAVARWIDSL